MVDTKVIPDNFECQFNIRIPVLLKCAIFIAMGTLLNSCATASMPQQTYLNNANLSGISKVAIVVSVTTPKVSYSLHGQDDIHGAGSQMIPPIITLFTYLGAVVRSGVDAGHAGTISDRFDFSHIEEKTAQSFMESLKKGNCFKVVEYIKDKNSENRQLSTAGYDAIIRLSVNEISLKRTAGGYVDLHLYAGGKMESLLSGKILWDREERVLSPESRSLEYYKENGLKELEAMLEKTGKYLAYDFVYLK